MRFHRRGHRELNSEVNLVPFVDLLSVCICFLLMTAVWLQVGSIEVKQSHGTVADEPSTKLELRVRLVQERDVFIDVMNQGRPVASVEVKGEDDAKFQEAFVAGVYKMLPPEAQIDLPAVVASAFIVPASNYRDMVNVMDALRRQKLANLAVMPTKAG
jgi:biopolymer transport protein TolR